MQATEYNAIVYDKNFIRKLKETFELIIGSVKEASKAITSIWNAISACIIPPRVLYLSKHHRKLKVRKKNLNRIDRLWKRLLKRGLK